MKRLLPALTLGVLVSAVVLTLHISRAAMRPELALSDWISHGGTDTRLVSDKLQFPLVLLIAAAVAWATLETKRRNRLAIVVGALVLELLAVAWVFGLYHTFFQPVPAMLAALLSFGASVGFVQARHWWRNRPEKIVPVKRDPASFVDDVPPIERPAPVPVNPSFQAPLPPSPPPPRVAPAFGEAGAHEVTAVVCDIGNKHDLAEELEPAAFIALTQRFMAHAAKAFSDVGAYVDAGSGEGVIAIFGFPHPDAEHAEKATREAMRLVESFPESSENSEAEYELHAGVSSGKVVIALSRNGSGALTVGEPVELARRFCLANRFYGSRVLIGPGTFELAADTIIARPIDFLTGVDARERHEIYQPLSATHDVPPDQIRRRDSFWNGVVLYREKRWAESYAQFQQARGPDEGHDAPLQLYLRRLEPLALQLTDTPFDG